METIHFGTCRVDIGQREIWRDDQLYPVAPKVFELLVLLLQHEGQVVPKVTLFHRVWGGRQVSDGVLANTVMKARKAIGDEGEAARIKTVHRVGYRFVGTVDRLAAQNRATTPSAEFAAPARTRRIGLLPFVNETGEAQLAWTELGLSTLTGQALAADPHASVIPMGTMLRALDTQPAAANPGARASALRSMLGLDLIVQAVLRREGTVLCLDYRTFNDGAAPALRGSVASGDATALPELLAQRLRAVFSDAPVSVPVSDLEDSYSRETFARAMAFFAQRQWSSAIQLLRVLVQLEPESVSGRLWLVHALLRAGDPGAQSLGHQLLAEATARGDERLQAQLHLALARSAALGPVETMAHHLAEAARLARRQALDDEAIETEMLRAFHAHATGDHPASRAHYERVEQASRAAGNDLRLLMCLCNRVELEREDGRLLTAKLLAEDALSVARRYNLPYAAYCLASLAAIHAALGLLDVATAQMQQAMAGRESWQDVAVASHLLETALLVYRETDDATHLDEVLRCGQPLLNAQSGVRRNYYRLACGQRAACVGDLASAACLMREAIDTLEGWEGAFLQAQWRLTLLEVELKARRWPEVRQLCAAIAALPHMKTSVECEAGIVRAQATQLHAERKPAAAIERLLAVVALTPMGRTNALSRIDLAWLRIEAGDLARAEQALLAIEPWLTQHPLGMLVAARLAYAQGRIAAAAAAQRQALARYATPGDGPGNRHTYFHALQVIYDSAKSDARQAPLAPMLPSWL